MIFKKFTFFTSTVSVLLFTTFCSFMKFYGLDLNYFFLWEIENLKFGSILDVSTLSFVFMVMVVTSLVSVYSEMYMEHYNNKKFFILMLMFFSSMIFLSFSKSFLNLMIGWDLLGLTSICLIMFYPNKTTMNNSILTMFFNRLGDLIMIFIISFCIFSHTTFYAVNDNFSFPIIIIMLICSFTKSAQFPLSSWLPAAMSAPTPISAMVHSSTLVTAGIFLMHKLMFYVKLFYVTEMFYAFSMLTFLVGGFLAVLELDFKKIVAFSTMSQISMILIFCSINLIMAAMMHMIFHAFFKTLLFCCCGIFFIFNFSDQIYKYMESNSKILNFLFFLSIYSMSGLFFCVSFFSKDLILESSNETSELYFMFLMLGSIFTLLYSSKLLMSSYSWIGSFKLSLNKKMNLGMLILFSFLMLYSEKIVKIFLIPSLFPSISETDMYVILIIMYSSMLINLNKFKFSNIMMHFSHSITFMKFFSFSIYSEIMGKGSLMNFTLNDEMFMKPTYVNIFKMEDKSFVSKKSNFWIFILISITLLCWFQ